MPSGLAAKKLGMSPRTLGKITGNLFVLLPDGKEDIGLYVKHGNKGCACPTTCARSRRSAAGPTPMPSCK